MASPSRSAITPLLEDGKLKVSFEGHSDDELRLALAQIIDGLERLDEIFGALECHVGIWRDRTAARTEEQWNESKATVLTTTPVVDMSPADALESNQCVLGNEAVLVRDMPRDQAEAGIRDAFIYFDRFRIMGEAMSRDAGLLLGGTHLQDEGSKADLRAFRAAPKCEFSQSLKSPRSGPKP